MSDVKVKIGQIWRSKGSKYTVEILSELPRHWRTKLIEVGNLYSVPTSDISDDRKSTFGADFELLPTSAIK